MQPVHHHVTQATDDRSAGSLFIVGQTRAGQPFRPSDWVDRMAGLFATFGSDKRLRYSPWVRPVTLNGKRGLWVDDGFRHGDPRGFAFLMSFVHAHDLAASPVAKPRADAG